MVLGRYLATRLATEPRLDQTVWMLEHLTDAPGTTEPEPFAGPDHPMRKVTRRVAFEGQWSPERAGKVAALFDSMAEEWAGRADPLRTASIRDAVYRGGVPTGGRWLELGSGTGAGTAVLAEAGVDVVALDIAAQMLACADPDHGPLLRADSCSLPIATASVDAVLCVNMLLFPDEVDRVLTGIGSLVWVNSLGDQTPIYLPPEDVLAALPGEWTGVTARAGSGVWLVARRS